MTADDSSGSTTSAPTDRVSSSLGDRMLVEAVGVWERIEPSFSGDSHADEVGRTSHGDFEHRLIVRAQAMTTAPALHEALGHVRSATGLAIFAGAVLAVLAGAATARAALGTLRDEPVNFFWAFGGLLGVQTLALLLWMILFIASRQMHTGILSTASLGGMLLRIAQFLAARLHKGPHHAAAIAAVSKINLRGKIGRWTLASITHGLWLAFNAGCLISLIVLLSARQYTFAWETTILSEREYVPLTQAISAVPKLLGFATPTQSQIEASYWTSTGMTQQNLDQLADARQAWSSLLVGSLVIYGLAPRLLFLGFSLGQRRRARHRHRIDISRPEYVRWHAALMPQVRSLGIVDRNAANGADLKNRHTAHTSPRLHKPIGSPAIMGFEIAMLGGSIGWPPPVHGVRWIDLGFVEDRDDQHRVLQQLATATEEPATVVIVCALTTTPDRGVGAFFREVSQAVSQPITLVLTGGNTLRQRSNSVQLQQRIDDWIFLGQSSNIERSRIIELDLDHLTQASAVKLASVLTVGDGDHRDAALKQSSSTSSSSAQRVREAFDLIVHHARQWIHSQTPPTAVDQAELHRAIAQVYRGMSEGWKNLLSAPGSLSVNVAGQMRSSADRILQLLPPRLLKSPRWLAAGAAAGALGCIAAATLIAPVAIASLPMWSAIGAAIAAFLPDNSPTETSAKNSYDHRTSNTKTWSAVRAATLFAVLLELQCRDESAITRMLDQIFTDDHVGDDRNEMNENALTVELVQQWIERHKHALEIALAAETRR